MPNGAGAVADPPVVILRVRGREQDVELFDGVHDRHRDAVVAAEPSAFTLAAALLVGAFLPWVAVERVEPEMRPERDRPLGFVPAASEQHPGHRGLQVVITDLVDRGAVQLGERADVALQERFLALGGEHPVHRLTRVRLAQGEQKRLLFRSAKHDPQISKVDLCLTARLVSLRDEALVQAAARLCGDLPAAPGHVVPHGRVRHIGRHAHR